MMAVAAGVYWVLRLAGFHQLFVNDAEGRGARCSRSSALSTASCTPSPPMSSGDSLLRLKTKYSKIKESGALKDLILFSKGRKEAARDPIVRSVRAYACAVTESEWECSPEARTAGGPTSYSPESSPALPTRLPGMNPSAGRAAACWKLPTGPAGTATKDSHSA
jgi:hypothetical protein